MSVWEEGFIVGIKKKKGKENVLELDQIDSMGRCVGMYSVVVLSTLWYACIR